MSAVTSPDINSLDFDILYDISGATPSITLTNTSAVVNPANLTWWYTIYTPSNTPIHVGSQTSPDVNGTAWTTLTIPSNSWPRIFGTGVCAQVEFSCSAPYVATLYVKDSEDNIFSLAKNQAICRPSGNTQNSCGNFGVATMTTKTDCANARLIVQNTTNLAYQDQIAPSSQANTWTLQYPQSPSGAIPSNAVVTNTPTAIFPLSYGGEGFNVYVNQYATYAMGNGVSIKVQYKAQKTFNVYCNVDLCQLKCEMDRFYAEAVAGCGEVTDPALTQKMTKINFLYMQVLTGVLQPGCDIDVPALIVQIEDLFGFKSTCCCGDGVNMSMAPVIPSSGDCCTTSVEILDVSTDSQFSSCPMWGGPYSVYNPTKTTIIGVANSVDELVSILNSDTGWLAYGVAFNAGNCDVGFISADTTVTIPPVYAAVPSADCVDNIQHYQVSLNDLCSPTIPAIVGDLPLNIVIDFDGGAGPEFVGTFSSVAAIVSALNSFASKPSSVTFTSATGSALSDKILIDIVNSSCSDYSGTITLLSDKGSSSFLAYGASHPNYTGTPAPINGGVIGYGMRDNSLVGEIPGLTSTNAQWHMVKIQNFLVMAEGNTGKIWFWDITNPLAPSFVRTIQLTALVPRCFTGLPTSKGIGGTTVSSYYSLYFPTDTPLLSVSDIYVFEGSTGCAWRVDMYGMGGTEIVGSFQNSSLIGLCPRVMQDSRLFFTLDGTLAVDMGGAPPVAPGYINLMDLTSPFDGSGIITQQIIGGGLEDVWAASFDGVDRIYFLGNKGTLMGYDVPTKVVTVGLVLSLGVGNILELRGNCKYSLGKLFVSSLGGKLWPLASSYERGAVAVDLTNYPASVTQEFFGYDSTTGGQYVHNVLPLGNCLVLVTREGYENSYFSQEKGTISVHKTDGTFLYKKELQVGQNIYNLVTFSNIPVYTPTTLIP